MKKFKNWKSTMAFYLFICIYVYTVVKPLESDIVSTAGHIALISSIFMMFRSDFTKEAINKLIENIKINR